MTTNIHTKGMRYFIFLRVRTRDIAYAPPQKANRPVGQAFQPAWMVWQAGKPAPHRPRNPARNLNSARSQPSGRLPAASLFVGFRAGRKHRGQWVLKDADPLRQCSGIPETRDGPFRSTCLAGFG